MTIKEYLKKVSKFNKENPTMKLAIKMNYHGIECSGLWVDQLKERIKESGFANILKSTNEYEFIDNSNVCNNQWILKNNDGSIKFYTFYR